MRPLTETTRQQYAKILATAFPRGVEHSADPAVESWKESTRQMLRAALRRHWADQGDEERGRREASRIAKGITTTVEYKYPTAAELEAFDAAVRKEPAEYRIAYDVLIGLGLRSKEYLQLPRAAVDEALRRSKLRVLGKGNKERIVEAAPAAEALEELLKRSWKYVYENYTVVRQDPIKRARANIDRWLRDLGERLGLGTAWSPHRLRHGFALRAVAAGIKLDYLQHHLGHSNIATTGRYLHGGDPTEAAKLPRRGK